MNGITRGEIREALIAALANVEGVDPAEAEAAVAAAGGDFLYELDSKVAECVIAEIGQAFGVTLAGPADLPADQYATVEALLDLLEHQLASAPEG